MTKSNRDEVNLKSTAYNQTGQNLFEQLSAYNSMSSHLRRVLMAKGVVDSRNKRYVGKKKEIFKIPDCKQQPLKLKGVITNDLIDRLAYDSRHHPADILKMSFQNSNCYDDCDSNPARLKIENNQNCFEERSRRVNSRSKSPPKITKFSSKVHPANARKTSRTTEYFQVPSECRCDEGSSRYESTSDVLSHGTPNPNLSVYSSGSQSGEEEPTRDNCDVIGDKHLGTYKDEGAEYAEFVYEITQEIMQHGLYTDKELLEVFKKHLEKNKGILNMSRMLNEIYQLKISLNILDDSDTDDELEDLLRAQRLLTVSKVRPPTPPKVLDDNKVMEKLMSYQKITEGKARASNKSVVLVDPNPELLITERDVLMSLMEADIEPKQAQRICKSLLNKSRDAFVQETVRIEDENVNSEEEINTDDHSDSDSVSQEVEREECCRIDDLVRNDDKSM